MELSGKTVVVTGAASGLGRGIATYFAQEKGCRIVALDLNAAGLESLTLELGAESVAAFPTDITDGASVKSSIRDAYDRFGSIDMCLNFAGIVAPVRMFDPSTGAVDLSGFKAAVSVNLVGTFNVMAHCAERMRTNDPDPAGERGVIINIASAAAFDGQVGQSGYSSSKAGVVGLSLPTARELARYGIRVVCIAPGAFDTPMLRSVPDNVVDRIVDTIQFPKRLGDISEIAGLCAHIGENRYLNGESIRLDGAMRMPAH